MAFKLQPNTAPFSYKVIIPAISDNGTIVRHQIEFKFKRLSRLEFNAMVKLHRTPESLDEDDDPIEIPEDEKLDTNTAQVLSFAVDWSGVIGTDGLPEEFNEENVRNMLNNYPNSFNAIVGAYIEAWQGGASRKN